MKIVYKSKGKWYKADFWDSPMWTGIYCRTDIKTLNDVPYIDNYVPFVTNEPRVKKFIAKNEISEIWTW